MNTIKLFKYLFIIAVFVSCNKDYEFKLETTKKTTLNKTITAKLIELNNKKVDSIQFFIDGKIVANQNNTVKIATSKLGVGKHIITALAFYPEKVKKINNSFEVFSNTNPAIYSYKIINTYPHDTNAYTQGLEYYNGFLYETTGRRGQSTLRKVDIKTGKVLKKIDLDKKYFGEGMTIVNNKIVWLTWQNKKGFVYDLNTFKQIDEFKYNKSKEGWGLTQNKTNLIKSDGTNKIWFLDKNTYQEKYAIQAYTHDRPLESLNELEYINNSIYGNIYQKSIIAIINPNTGVVEGLADLRAIEKEMKKTQKLEPEDEVLNGIAYDKKNDRLFVTGKNWGKLFEIKLIKKQ